VYQERNQGEKNLKALLNKRENFSNIQGKVIGGGEVFSCFRKCREASNTDIEILWKFFKEDELTKIIRAVEKTDDWKKLK
jgi:hypothetical protein